MRRPDAEARTAPGILFIQLRTTKERNILLICVRTLRHTWWVWLQKMGRIKATSGAGVTEQSFLPPGPFYLLNMLGLRADVVFSTRSACRNRGNLQQPGTVKSSLHFHPHFVIERLPRACWRLSQVLLQLYLLTVRYHLTVTMLSQVLPAEVLQSSWPRWPTSPSVMSSGSGRLTLPP